jgi:DNA repair exonuclease SbcCD ATPase subunit
MTHTTKALEGQIARIDERIARAAAERADAEEEISKLALADRPLNGQLKRRDELTARAEALRRERQRLADEELPLARRREADAEKTRRMRAAASLHAGISRQAAALDAALAAANEALAQLRAAWPAYAAEMRAAGSPVREPDWPALTARAAWAARAPARRMNRWRGPAEAPRPTLAPSLGLRPELRTHALAAAEQLRRFAPAARGEAAPDDAWLERAEPRDQVEEERRDGTQGRG